MERMERVGIFTQRFNIRLRLCCNTQLWQSEAAVQVALLCNGANEQPSRCVNV